MKKTLAAILTFYLISGPLGFACGQERRPTDLIEPDLPVKDEPAAKIKDPNSPVYRLLSDMNQAAQNIRTCRAKIDYLVVQDPELLDARTLRRGILYYQKNPPGSALLIDFETVKQDDGPEQQRLERYFFDGVWLTKIDYQLKQTQKYQQTPADKPMEVFEFISHHFPIVGFSGAANIEKNFKIFLSPCKPQDKARRHILLKVREDSSYKDEYTQVELWLDAKTSLPCRIVTLSTQGDRYEIDFKDVRVNEKLPEGIFKVSSPADFDVEVKPLENPEQ